MKILDSQSGIPHRRKPIISVEDGQTLKIRFDKAMGYWRIDLLYIWRNFDFTDDVKFQLG